MFTQLVDRACAHASSFCAVLSAQLSLPAVQQLLAFAAALAATYVSVRVYSWRYKLRHRPSKVSLVINQEDHWIGLWGKGLTANKLRFGYNPIDAKRPVLVSAYDDKGKKLGRTLRMRVWARNSWVADKVSLSINDLQSLGIIPTADPQDDSKFDWPNAIQVRVRNVSQYGLTNLWNYPDPATQLSIRVGIVSGFVFAIVSYGFAKLMDALLSLYWG